MKRKIFKYKNNRLYDTGTYRRSRSSIYWDRVANIVGRLFIVLFILTSITVAIVCFIREQEVKKQEQENIKQELALKKMELEIEKMKLTDEYKQKEANLKRRVELEEAIKLQKQEQKKVEEEIAKKLYPLGTMVYSKEVCDFGRVISYSGLSVHTENFDFVINEKINCDNANDNEIVKMLSARQYYTKTIY